MIRVLVVGSGCIDLANALTRAGIDSEPVRLPAAAVRAFEATPADAIVICGESPDRAAQIVGGFRARPLGGLVPIIAVSQAAVAGADTQLGEGTSNDEVAQVVRRVVLGETADGAQNNTYIPSSAVAVEQDVPAADLQTLLARIRHADYFAILGVARHTSVRDVATAHQRIRRQVEAMSETAPESVVAEIVEALDDAALALTDDRLRRAYLVATENSGA